MTGKSAPDQPDPHQPDPHQPDPGQTDPGRPAPPSPEPSDHLRLGEALRASLLRTARLIERLEADGTLLENPGDLQAIFGELRRRLFEWELRGLPPRPEPDPEEEGTAESLRIVREAEAARESLLRSLMRDGERPDDPTPR